MSGVDVLLIQPPFPWTPREVISIPLGLAWIGAVLEEAGYTVKALDLLLEGEKYELLKETLKKAEPKIVGIQAHSDASSYFALKVAQIIKKEEYTYTIFGGAHATFAAHELLQKPEVDFVIRGEGEYTTLELIQHLEKSELDFSSILGLSYRKNGNIIHNRNRPFITNLDQLPMPARHLFPWKHYPQWSIITSRGCPYRCIFCSAASLWRHQLRLRSAENVFTEMKVLVNKYDAPEFFILDDTFTTDQERIEKICNMLLREKIDIKWACLARADCVTPCLLNKMKKAGCVEIHYGVESANPKTLDIIRKSITIDQIKKAIMWTKKLGMMVRASWIIGLPGETAEDVLRSIDFMLEVEPNEVQIYPLIPYLGTEINTDSNKYCINILTKDYSRYFTSIDEPVVSTKYLTKQEIMRLTKIAVEKLVMKGYVHLTGKEASMKRGFKKVVATGFTPVQTLKDLTRERKRCEVF